MFLVKPVSASFGQFSWSQLWINKTAPCRDCPGLSNTRRQQLPIWRNQTLSCAYEEGASPSQFHHILFCFFHFCHLCVFAHTHPTPALPMMVLRLSVDVMLRSRFDATRREVCSLAIARNVLLATNHTLSQLGAQGRRQRLRVRTSQIQVNSLLFWAPINLRRLRPPSFLCVYGRASPYRAEPGRCRAGSRSREWRHR